VSATARQIAAPAGQLAPLAANFEQAAVITNERL